MLNILKLTIVHTQSTMVPYNALTYSWLIVCWCVKAHYCCLAIDTMDPTIILTKSSYLPQTLTSSGGSAKRPWRGMRTCARRSAKFGESWESCDIFCVQRKWIHRTKLDLEANTDNLGTNTLISDSTGTTPASRADKNAPLRTLFFLTLAGKRHLANFPNNISHASHACFLNHT